MSIHFHFKPVIIQLLSCTKSEVKSEKKNTSWSFILYEKFATCIVKIANSLSIYFYFKLVIYQL